MSNGKENIEIEDIVCLEAINVLYAYLHGEIDKRRINHEN